MSQPGVHLVYAVPPAHLRSQNGTSQRINSLRAALQQCGPLRETNLLEAPLGRAEQLQVVLALLLGLSNNLRYLGLRRRLPPAQPGETTLVVGQYCACLALLPRPAAAAVVVDLIDSLTLTDVRGVQSLWRWRPLLYLLQLPSSWLLERWLLRSSRVSAVLVTTAREQVWLQRLHGSAAQLWVVPNAVPAVVLAPPPLLAAGATLELAFVGALTWWVNRLSLTVALQILRRFLATAGRGRRIVFNLYGSGDPQGLARVSIPNLTIRVHGYAADLQVVARHNHAALLPNPIGRGFQNKLLSCVGMGLPTLAHASMNPHEPGSSATSPVLYCRSQADYNQALLGLWQLSASERDRLSAQSRAYVAAHFGAAQVEACLASALQARRQEPSSPRSRDSRP